MTVSIIKHIYAPPKPAAKLPENQVAKEYTRYRWQVMLSIFVGYAAYYLVRKNFSLAKPYLINELGMTNTEVGLIASMLSIAYGLSKFVMGNVSDRSNARFFMATGLILSGFINIFFGYLDALWSMCLFWFVNGWFQGMGWPPSGRVLTHWFSDRERGTMFACWNVSHNIGGGIIAPLCTLALILFASWQSLFYFPGFIAIILGIGVIIFLRDTPQSVGLPPIEEYKNDYPEVNVDDRERELTAREILYNHVLNNKTLWILALANCFIYVVRYGILDWAPTFLTAVKGQSFTESRWQFLLYEYAGIPGTLLIGWVSDKYFSGRRAPITVFYLLLVLGFCVLYWYGPINSPGLDALSLIAIGFLIYGPVMMIGVAAVDLVPKKAAGTAAGLTGLFGYFGGATIAELGIGVAVDRYGWNAGAAIVIGSCVLAAVLVALTWNVHDRSKGNI